MAPRSLLPVCAALAQLAAACGVGRTDALGGAEAAASGATECTRCHGTGSDPAPPRSTRGETATTAPGVGAHQAHLKDGPLHRAFACAECHVVPTTPLHADGTVQLTFGPLANAGGVASAWSRASATCTTACHGAALAGGTRTAPVWTGGAGEAACGSCHGAPPPAPHPATTADCGACHEGYTRTTVNLAIHVNGRVDVAGGGTLACGTCHGLPPAAPHPQVSSCGDCHAGYTATAVDAATHRNGRIDVSLSAASCAECHGKPPATGAHRRSEHVNLSCGSCHAGYTPSTENPALHRNGTPDVGGAGTLVSSWNRSTRTCAPACHGSERW